MRARRVVVPGLSVALRMAAEAMSAAEAAMIDGLDARLSAETKDRQGALLSEKTHPRQSRFSWLREPAPRVGRRSLLTVLDRIDLVRATGATGIEIDEAYGPRMAQLAREGVRTTAQAFGQMRAPRRHVILVATLRELEVAARPTRRSRCSPRSSDAPTCAPASASTRGSPRPSTRAASA